MEQLIELLKQIQELAGVAIEALQGAQEGGAEGATEGREAATPPEGGNPRAAEGPAPRGAPGGGGGEAPPPEERPPGR